MSRVRDEGCVHAYSKVDGNAWLISRAEYPRLRADWLAGKAFFECDGFFGSKLAFRLTDIYAISDNSPESLAANRADTAQDNRDNAIQGPD